MKSKFKNVDTIQIVGFLLSGSVSIGLLLAGQDTLITVVLGFVLAALTQLFDIQKRLSDAEERLIKANALSQKLYRDEKQFKRIQQIVTDFEIVQSGWYEPFKLRADEILDECRDISYSLANNVLITQRTSPYSIGAEAFDMATESIKAVIVHDIRLWKNSPRTEKYIQAYQEATNRGVDSIRIFVQPAERFEEVEDLLLLHRDAGVKVYFVVSEDLPKELKEEYILLDDRILSKMEFTGDGQVRGERISIDLVEVGQVSDKFNVVLRFAKGLEDVLENRDALLSQRPA